MFEEVGKELKFWAKVSVWIVAIIGGVIGALVAAAVEAPGIVYISFIALFGLVGYVLGRFAAILFYSYAEIVDCVQQIKEKIVVDK